MHRPLSSYLRISPKLISNFANFLISQTETPELLQKMEDNPEYRAKLVQVQAKIISIVDSKTILGSASLADIKSTLESFRDEFVNALKNLDEEDLDFLEAKVDEQATALPLLFNSIFELVKEDKHIDETLSIEYESNRNSELSKICNSLIKGENYKKAERVALYIDNPFVKNKYIAKICMKLANQGKFEEALRLVEHLEEVEDVEPSKEEVRAKICIKMADQGQGDQAIELATTKLTPESQLFVFKHIIDNKDFKDFDQFIEIATKIPDGFVRGRMLINILHRMGIQGDKEKINQIAYMIRNMDLKDLAGEIPGEQST